MFKSKKVFITIEFADIPGLFDYPKHLPIPSKDDVVHFDGKFGKVEVIKHMTEGTVTDIRIKCSLRGNCCQRYEALRSLAFRITNV